MSRGKKVNLRQHLALDLFAKLQDQYTRSRALKTLFWECTLRCNLSCKHCGSDCRTDSRYRDMPIADFLKVIDSITPHIEQGKTMIIISGGEPLVRTDIEDCGIELYRRGFAWGIVTNGLNLTAQRFDRLLKAGIASITVSIDGLEDYHNWVRQNPASWSRAMEAAKIISHEDSVASDVVTCVTGRNYKDLEQIKNMLIDAGVKSWRIFNVFPVGRAFENEDLTISDEQFQGTLDFIEATKKEGRIAVNYACEGFLGGYEGKARDNLYQCYAGISIASVRIDGAISGCNSVRSSFQQGNIYEDDFWDVWQNRFEKFRNREWTKKDECQHCKVWKWCRGGGMHLRDNNDKLMVCHYNRLK